MTNQLHEAYFFLGVEPGSSIQTVLQRYKALVMAWHPDRFVTANERAYAQEEVKNINIARDILKAHFERNHQPVGPCPCRLADSTDQKKTRPEYGGYPLPTTMAEWVAYAGIFFLVSAGMAAAHNWVDQVMRPERAPKQETNAEREQRIVAGLVKQIQKKQEQENLPRMGGEVPAFSTLPASVLNPTLVPPAQALSPSANGQTMPNPWQTQINPQPNQAPTTNPDGV